MDQFFLNHSQSQKIILTNSLKQGLEILQMPFSDLENWLEQQIDENPFLDKAPLKTHQNIETANLSKKPSRYEYLTRQASLHFQKEELEIAKEIIGNLDEKGFFQKDHLTTIEQKVLSKIQEFNPPGIAACNLQECLLLQLRLQGKKKSIAFQILSQCYFLLLHQKWDKICKVLKISKHELFEAIYQDIARLTLNPSHMFETELSKYVYPDILFEQKGIHFVFKTKELPKLKIINPYKAFDSSSKKWIEKKIKSLNWLQKNIKTREMFLQKIAQVLLKTNLLFIKGEKVITPISIKDVALEFNIHISTAHRIIANKYISTPNGIFPLKSFFASSITSNEGGKISHHEIFNQLKLLINTENKSNPFSDLELVRKLQEQGIRIARRTLTKYREKLKIPSSKIRKNKKVQLK